MAAQPSKCQPRDRRAERALHSLFVQMMTAALASLRIDVRENSI